MTAAIDVLIFLAIVGALALLTLMMFFGWDQMLRSGIRKRVQPGEPIVFESYAARSALGLLSPFSLSRIYLIVTNRRLIYATWILPPFWRGTKEILLTDIDNVTPLSVLRLTQVQLSIRGEKIAIMPQKSRYWPFAENKGRDLIDAINRGRAA